MAKVWHSRLGLNLPSRSGRVSESLASLDFARCRRSHPRTPALFFKFIPLAPAECADGSSGFGDYGQGVQKRTGLWLGRPVWIARTDVGRVTSVSLLTSAGDW